MAKHPTSNESLKNAKKTVNTATVSRDRNRRATAVTVSGGPAGGGYS